MAQRKSAYLAVMLVLFVSGLALLLFDKYHSAEQPQMAPVQHTFVRLGTFLTAIDYAPYYIILKRDKELTEELRSMGYVVQHLEPFQSAPPINEAFATDRVDGVFNADIPTIVSRAAGIDVRIVWLSARIRSQIVVSSSSSISSLAALKGKRIAVLSGTSPHFGLLKNLHSIGLTPDDVEIVDMPPPDAKAAFEAGYVDAWTIWPPFVEQEIVSGRGKALPDVVSPANVVFVMRGPVLDADGRAVAAIIKALERAKAWLRENPSSAQELVSKELRLPLEVIKLAWAQIDWDATLDSSVITDIQAKADFLQEIGLIKTHVNVDQMITNLEPRPIK